MRPITPAEQARLDALQSYEILDTAPELDFDRLTQLASVICQTPIAFISIIDRTRQWCKSVVGLNVLETERTVAFCDHVIQGTEFFQVCDAHSDARFADNPLVAGNFGLRFYAGVPLVTSDGFALGALAVVDSVPRELNQVQTETLKTLAEQVTTQLEARRQRIASEKVAVKHRRLELFKAEQAAIMEKIVTEAPLPTVLDAIVRMMEGFDPRFLCSILLLDESGKHLRHGAGPNLPAAYMQAIDGLQIGPYRGSCGTAAYEQRFVAAADIATDPLWRDYRDLALGHNLRACWSMPIFSATGGVQGTFAAYASFPGTPDTESVELLRSCSHIVSLAIERHRTTQVLRESEERFREQASLLDKTQDAIISRTIDGRITFWNKGAERMFGWTKEQALGRFVQKSSFYKAEGFYAATEKVVALGEWSYEAGIQRKDGRNLLVEARLSLVKHDDGNPKSVLVSLTDITRRKEVEQEIHHLAFYDQLTKLPNRRLMYDRLQHALMTCERSGQKGAVILIDLDNFKTLNDTLGHDKGDLLLRQVAKRIVHCVRECDTVARFGGDEFIVVLEDLGSDSTQAKAGAETVAQKIIGALNHQIDIEGYGHTSTPSIGITLFPGHSNTVDKLLKEADMAMYQAKAKGRNTLCFFDPEMQMALASRSKLEADLRTALAKKEFQLYYQPQITKSGHITGMEALMRWQHPARGFVSPAKFIPLAEDTGMIIPLGLWVLKAACEQLVAWEKCPLMHDLDIAINVSVHQFRRPNFVESLFQILDETGANPTKLKLEITESLLVEDTEATIAKMMAIKEKGICFALDDFGTGYSSLSYLKRLPLDQLKIDQSFTRDVLADPNDAAIARTIIALANSLDLGVIAEGVETEEQRQLLATYGCGAYQGYLFSKPLPEDQLRAFVMGR